MDRALGVLPPDTEALVAAYLTHDPTAAERARQYELATHAARRLMQQDRPSLPPFPAARLLALDTARRRLRVLRNAAGLAAMLVVGIGLGFFMARHERHGASADKPSPIPLPRREGGVQSVPRGTFWSTEQIYESVRVARSVGSTRWIWDSAVSLPRPGAK